MIFLTFSSKVVILYAMKIFLFFEMWWGISQKESDQSTSNDATLFVLIKHCLEIFMHCSNEKKIKIILASFLFNLDKICNHLDKF